MGDILSGVRSGLASGSKSTGTIGSSSTPSSSWDDKFSTVATGLTGLLGATTGLIGTLKGSPSSSGVGAVDEPPPNQPRNNTTLYLIIGVVAVIGLLFMMKNK